MMLYVRLFYEFFKIGLFAVGGGLATLPFLSELAQWTGWYTGAQLADMVAIAESTPGPIGVNMATYAGYQAGGVLGSAVATLGLVIPSVIVILLIARALNRFSCSPVVAGLFCGLRPASVAMIASAFVGLVMITLVHVDAFRATGSLLDLIDLKALALAVVIFVLTKKTKWHPAVFLLGAGIVGVLLSF